MVFRGPRVFWALAHVFRGQKVLDLGSCFSEVERFWILAQVSKRTKCFLGFGSCLQRAKGSGSWLIFSENQRFWILAHVFRGPRILGSWLMFFRGPRFWALAHVFRGPKVLDPGS